VTNETYGIKLGPQPNSGGNSASKEFSKNNSSKESGCC